LPETAAALRLVEQAVRTLPPPAVPSIQVMPKQEAGMIVRRRRPSRTA
jgi:hypothetical protein